ncbi:N-acetyltransferase [Myxococcota bacterium]|nr:N-acetyltransferase [Myxococcota bacterium]
MTSSPGTPPSLRAPATVSPVRVVPVSIDDRRAKERFIRFPWSIYPKGSPWCPPLFMDRRDFLNPAKNPFFDHACVQLFLAERGGEIVGRIAACEDRRGNAHWGSKAVNFGFFECVDDDAVAGELLEAAADWGRARGLDRMVGPLSFNTNHEAGLLVEGFDEPPAIQMPYNPPYYRGLLERQGFEKEMDLYAWWLSATADPPQLPRLQRLAEKIREKAGIAVRNIRLKDWDAEVQRVQEVYNDAWDQNWNFVPFTDAEFRHTAKDLRMVVKEDLAYIAEHQGRPVAFSLTILDANQAIRHADGRLFPFGILRLLWHLRRIDRLRLIALGIRHGYRRRGIESVFYLETFAAARRLGYRGGEIGWTLESNDLINRAIEMMGGRKTKTYRAYVRPT